ncbi:MAG: DUF1805 domain-containing protein [Alicyclobacillaceae bacterium]|uniref:YunC family protein n=1 Tax=Alicyclobacillus sp. SP_1 TaxID=2942475 RepID=UPI002157A586|nr:DUF1805 domain-containing protein [Alicyclobacillus sp. SP_1]MCY0887609.1 DUF1805 domain-containing protein [Alicyclobacillaceae bacterium]MCY0897064.1 DUF1805 domain-containing protein [Alicyclobacillaceae bacterium]
MISVYPISVDDHAFIAVEVALPKTNLLAITTSKGYVMCGALDVELLRTRLKSREILAARAVGVKTIEELLEANVESCTQAAEDAGIQPGTPIREALLHMV